jgi:hypothetical protein
MLIVENAGQGMTWPNSHGSLQFDQWGDNRVEDSYIIGATNVSKQPRHHTWQENPEAPSDPSHHYRNAFNPWTCTGGGNSGNTDDIGAPVECTRNPNVRPPKIPSWSYYRRLGELASTQCSESGYGTNVKNFAACMDTCVARGAAYFAWNRAFTKTDLTSNKYAKWVGTNSAACSGDGCWCKCYWTACPFDVKGAPVYPSTRPFFRPTLALGNKCASSNKCAECQGGCDSDADCQNGLKCFQRTSRTQPVAGCEATGYASTRRRAHALNYCYNPSSTHGYDLYGLVNPKTCSGATRITSLADCQAADLAVRREFEAYTGPRRERFLKHAMHRTRPYSAQFQALADELEWQLSERRLWTGTSPTLPMGCLRS